MSPRSIKEIRERIPAPLVPLDDDIDRVAKLLLAMDSKLSVETAMNLANIYTCVGESLRRGRLIQPRWGV